MFPVSNFNFADSNSWSYLGNIYHNFCLWPKPVHIYFQQCYDSGSQFQGHTYIYLLSASKLLSAMFYLDNMSYNCCLRPKSVSLYLEGQVTVHKLPKGTYSLQPHWFWIVFTDFFPWPMRFYGHISKVKITMHTRIKSVSESSLNSQFWLKQMKFDGSIGIITLSVWSYRVCAITSYTLSDLNYVSHNYCLLTAGIP